MTANLIDLRLAADASSDGLAGLQAYLAQLIGETFQLARVSYGDELTLRFGDLRPAPSPKLKGHLYGSFVLGLRGSPWMLKSGSEPLLLTSGIDLQAVPAGLGTPIAKEELEAAPLVEPHSRVLSATPFVVRPDEAIGLELRLSDGSTLRVLPTRPDADEPPDEGLPELADWELSSPAGLLSADPGLRWSFRASAKRSA